MSSTEDRRRWLDDPARWGPIAVVGAAVLFGLIVLWPERADVWYLNDASVHRSMVGWAADRIRDGHMPFDGWYPYLSLGASRFHHYQSLPHILTGTVSLVGGEATFRWSLYLLLAFWPVSVYAGGRLLGLGRWPAAAAALISPLLSSVPGLGYEWGSYVWRGSGTWAQLWGMWALPFAWGLCWQAIAKGKRLWLAALVLGITICLHLLTGYLALCCVGVFVVVAPREIVRRLGRAAIVVAGALLASAWMLVPLLTDAGWTVNDEFSRGTIYYDSFGARKILVWLGTGDLLDRGRLPLITILAGVGLVFAVVQARRREPPRVLIGLGLVSMVLFFGRPTLGFVIDLLPGGGDLFLRRFINGVHLAALYLAGLGLMYLVNLLMGLLGRWKLSPKPVIAIALVVAAVLATPAVIERVRYERQGGRWIDEQAQFEATDGVGYEALVERSRDLGPGRIFSEQRGPSVSQYRIGQVPTFAALLNLQADAIGFTRPTWSLASPAEYRFDIGDPDMRELFGVRYVIWPEDRQLPAAQRVAQVGRHVLWEFPDTGYLDVVDTIAPVAADRENIGQQTSSILRSGLFEHRFVPTVAFGGRDAAAPTLGPDEQPRKPPGLVVSETADPADGAFGGSVEMDRPGVVLFKVSYDPRWQATVDGEPVEAQMLSPALVGVPVPEGEHDVALEYQPYPLTGPLVLVGIGAIAGLWYVERRRRRAPGSPQAAVPGPIRRMKRMPVVVGLLSLLMIGATACSDDVDPDQALKEGLAQQQAGDLEAAAEQYQMVLDVRPDDQYANYNMGVIEQADGRTALAEGYYRAALDTAPDFVPALFNLAILRTKVGATQEAIDLYERVIVIQPEYAAAHLNLGLLYRDANEPKLAQQHLNTAVELDPSLADRITLDENPAPAPPASASPKPSESASP